MVIRVKLPDGNYGKFPDYMSNEQIEGVIHKQFGKPESSLAKGFKNVGKDWKDFLKDAAIGGLEMGRGIANTPHNIANLLGHPDAIPNFADPEFDYAKALGAEEDPNITHQAVRMLSQYAPAMALPGANIGRAGEAIGAIPKIGEFLAGATEQAIPQAAFGATQNTNPLKGAAEGGLGSLAGSAIGKGIESGINALRPSKIFRGQLSPKQLKQNVKVTKDTETGLGRVIESPLLTRIQENVLPHVLGSGAENTAQKNAKKIQETGTAIVKKLTGNTEPHQFGIELQDALKLASKEAKAGKDANYAKLNKIADKHGLIVGRKNFQQAAIKTIEDIEKSPELKHEFGGDLYKDLLRYSKNKEGNNLKLTNIFRGKLGDKANELYQSGKMHEYGIIKDLQSSLSNDIEEAFKAAKNPNLKEAYQKSQKEYKENFAPFEDKDIVKFTRQGGDPDLILNHFLKGGHNDRATLLAKLDRAYKLNNKSTGNTNNLLPSAYLSKAFNEEGEINPLKFRALYNKLGHNQRKILFGDGALHKKIKNYSDLVGKNAESFNLMHNPKTGHRLATLAQMVTAPSHIGSALIAALGGKTANKILTSPKYREKIVNAMIKNKSIEIPKVKQTLQKGGAIVSGLGGNDEEENSMKLEVIGKRK